MTKSVIVITCNATVVPNGTYDKGIVKCRGAVQYSCDAGFRLQGDGSPNCTADRNLTSIPGCIRKYGRRRYFKPHQLNGREIMLK